MTKLGRLVSKFYRLNLDRHNWYRKRANANRTMGVVWSDEDQAKLLAAAAKKKAASKELVAYLKKSGLCVVWGDTNQLISIQPIRRRDNQRKALKKSKDRWAQETMKITLDKVDLL